MIWAPAYSSARRHARDERFVFGKGKPGDLVAFTGALVAGDDRAANRLRKKHERLIHPVSIAFNEAIALAAVGPVVNRLSAWLACMTTMMNTGIAATSTTTITKTAIRAPPMSTWPPARRSLCLS